LNFLKFFNVKAMFIWFYLKLFISKLTRKKIYLQSLNRANNLFARLAYFAYVVPLLKVPRRALDSL